jgi:kinesin family protein 2/24
MKLNVCVRKRPLFPKEIEKGEIDCISVANPNVSVHECKKKVDGITKYVDNHDFTFDNAFYEKEDTEDLYLCSVQPLIPSLLQNGVVTVFAYGQTGSGKTHTMKGVQDNAIKDLYNELNGFDEMPMVYVSFYEIYGGKLYDLLNNKKLLAVQEDHSQ